MQSFRERCGFHGNQQNYQPTPSQDSSRLENYRHQSQAGPHCERQRLVAKEYYSQQPQQQQQPQPQPQPPQLPYQAYGENSAVDKYHRGNKQLRGQQLQGRPASFPNFAVQENSPYPTRYSREESLQAWGSQQPQPPQPLPGGVAKYEENLMKKSAAPSGSRQYHEQAPPQLPFRTHSLHLQQQQQQQQQPPGLTYPKLQRPKMQNEVSSPMSFPQGAHFTQHSQSFPASSTYSPAPSGSQAAHSYKSCSTPSAPQHERPLGNAASLPSGQRVQNLHGYQPNRIGYDQQQQQQQPQQQPMQGRHHTQESLHYQNLAKYQHFNQPGQSYCQADGPVRTPDQYYQTFSPSSSHSPARSVGRSPSYSSTPSPLMPNLENFQYSQQSLSTGTFPASLADHSHFMPLLNPSPTDGASPDTPPTGNCKNLPKDKIPENLLSDLSLQSLTALTSQVENIANTVQQLLLSKSTGMPQKKGIKNSPRTPEQLKGQHCSPEGNNYSSEQAGTPLSDPLSTPQSIHAEAQDADYLSGSEEQLERGFLYCNQSRSPARVNSKPKAKPESVSTCSVTSPDDMSTKSDDSFQSIHTSLPLETFTKFVANERDCPLLLSALSQEELASEIIGLQDAINEKTDKGWANSPAPNKDPDKSPFHLENHRTCLDSMVKSPWPSQGDSNTLTEPLKLEKTLGGNNGKNFTEEVYNSTQVAFTTAETKSSLKATISVGYNSKPNVSVATSSSEATSFSCYSNATANSVGSENAMENFDWPDENLSDTWKELGSSLQAADLSKSLFSGKMSESCEEKKNTCCLSLCNSEQAAEPATEQAEAFSQPQASKGENLTYDEASRAESEQWLEDTTRQSCSGDFSELPMMSSPDLKESDLEPEDYSSLCELAGSVQKSITYDAFTPKPAENAPALSLQDTPGSAEETPNVLEKETTESSHLSDQSMILLGPAVGTETKVKSWFESSLHHLSPEDEAASGENTVPDKMEYPATLLAKKPAPPENVPIISEPTSRGKSLRSKKVQCRLSGAEEPVKLLSSPCPGNQAAGMVANKGTGPNSLVELPTKNAHGQTPRFPAEGLRARMCTRSFTALTEPRVPDPLEGSKASTLPEKLGKKPTCVLKQRVTFKARKANGKPSPKPSDPAPALLQSLGQSEDVADQKAKEGDVREMDAKVQQSMILRSRTRIQEVFKRRREKSEMDDGFQNDKTPKKLLPNNHLPVFKLGHQNRPDSESKLAKRVRLSKARPGMGNKMVERPLHALKRKPSFIPSVIPAKKRNLVLRSSSRSSSPVTDEKPDASPGLFKRLPSVKKAKVKPSPKNPCEPMLKSPQAKENPSSVCIKLSSRAAFQGAMKTKVLPPRKGRGLKLEAIVQKITSPNLKKFACKTATAAVSSGIPFTTAAATSDSNPLSPSLPEREQASKNASATPAVGEARPLNQAMPQKAPAVLTAEQLCRSPNNRSFRGKLMNSKKLSSNCFKGEAYSSPETLQSSGGGGMAASGIGLLPKKRNRKGCKTGAFLAAKNSLDKCPHLSPALALASREKAAAATAAGREEEGQRQGKKPKAEDKGFSHAESAEGRASQAQTRAQKQRASHPNYNGYTKRQRKRLTHRKAKSVPSRCRSRAKRRHQQQVPLLSPAEPEIRLKYVSCKRLRTDRIPPFSPYVRVEKQDAFVTTCTVVNCPADEAKLHNEPCSVTARGGLFGVASLQLPAILPLSSTMHLGPVVSKTLNATCLVCCLCRNPANYKDQGDLCGPYYPEDCLPKKKSRLKEKIKVEGLSEEPPSPAVTERLLKATDNNNCAASVPGGKVPRLDSGADSAKQNSLRSSSRGMFRKLQSCYCCDERTEGEEAAVEKPRRHECGKAESPPPEPMAETQEHWVHEACAIWTAGVYLVGGKLYGLQEAIKMAADVRCSGCQQVGATVSCCHKGCAQTFHYTCAIDTGCLLTEETFSLNCPKHKKQAL